MPILLFSKRCVCRPKVPPRKLRKDLGWPVLQMGMGHVRGPEFEVYITFIQISKISL